MTRTTDQSPARFVLFFERATPSSDATSGTGGPAGSRRPADPATASAAVRWRLLAANHRLLAVGGRAFSDADAASTDIEAVRQGVLAAADDDDGPDLVRMSQPGLWSWAVDPQRGSSVVRSPHPYPRAIDARRALQRFLELAPDAAQEAGVRRPGRRTPRTSEQPR